MTPFLPLINSRNSSINLMNKKLILYTIIFCLSTLFIDAQEVVTGLQINEQIKRSSSDSFITKGSSANDTIELPFFDDFSGHSVFPDARKWSDRNAFINNTYSNDQITTGIATLDAIDQYGNLYETASPDIFEADHLTSQPVNLNYSASENIWLSFLFQAGGLGDLPEKNDTLTLQFYAPEESKWYSVWRAEGTTTLKRFVPAIIRINQPRFLKRGFRFRFVNHASLSSNLNDPSMIGNCDHWNLDYVLLDRNRNEADTIFRDVAFRLPLRSALKTHEAIPWRQFRQVYLQEMGSAININYRNNDIIVRNVTRNFEIKDVYKNTLVHSFSAGATNLDPRTDINYNANLIYTFNSDNADSALFLITSYLITDDFDPKENDTLKYFQFFSNYFAFDDGSAEGGYGINGLGSRNAMVAYRFRSFTEDTLRALSICFNDSYLNSNRRAFNLMVWNDNNGTPGDVLYSLEDLMVEKGDRMNGFHTYILPDGVMISGDFYVGWKQRSETFLNAGFDVNTPHRGRQLYWLNGVWNQSQVQGSVMIRPVTGDPLKTTSIDDIVQKEKMTFRLWPNPASDYISVDCDEPALSGKIYIAIFDLNGREIMKVPYSERIDITSLGKGIYIVVTTVNGKPSGFNRLVKTR